MNDKKISEDYFEFMLKRALEDYAEEEGKCLQEQLKNIEEPDLSKKYKNNIRKISRQLNKNYKLSKKIKAASILLVVLFSGTAVTYNVNADFKSFINKLFTKEDTHINITYNKSNLEYDFSQIPESWEYFYIPEYMPAGYKVEEIKSDDSYIYISYANGEDTIDFEQRKGNVKLSIDTENSEVYEINISGSTGYIQKRKSLTIIYWNNSDIMFDISGNIDDSELIKIAESIYIVGR